MNTVKRDLHIDSVIALFDNTFYQSYNTRLVHANTDPEYLPAEADISFHRICFAHGYIASALHEIAHWCVAGEARRQLVDFGYWYAPDGRNAEQQKAFLQVEVKPQALEWVFSVACGKNFRISSDNLNGVELNTDQFETDVIEQIHYWLEHGLPQRAGMWAQACAEAFGGSHYLEATQYTKLTAS